MKPAGFLQPHLNHAAANGLLICYDNPRILHRGGKPPPKASTKTAKTMTERMKSAGFSGRISIMRPRTAC